MTDVPYEKLIAYAAGELTGQDRQAIEAWLATNPDARSTIARFQAARLAIQMDDSPDVPVDALAHAKRLFTEKQARAAANRPSWLELAVRTIANVIFDSRHTPALAGIRGALQGFQVTIENDAAEVDLQLQPDLGSSQRLWHVVGQINPRESADAAGGVALVAPGTRDPFVTTIPDRHGMFQMDAVPGTYDLLVSVGESIMVFEKLELS